MTWGFSSSTTNASNLIHNAIQKQVIKTLRAGLITLPKGSVVPASLGPMRGENFTLYHSAYPDLNRGGVTNPLTEGTPPANTVLGVSTLTFNAAQFGLSTTVTDIASFQSPHNLAAIAADKVARAVADEADRLGLAALTAHGIDRTYRTSVLSTAALLDAVGELEERDVAPVPGVGFYAIMHPWAARGLAGESGITGFIDVSRDVNPGALTGGARYQYRGVTILTSSNVAGTLSSAVTGPTGAFATDVFTLAGHGLSEGTRIQLASKTGGGTNIAVDTDYYLRDVTTDTFKLAATRGGAAIDLNTSDITASTMKTEVFPIYFMGQDAIAAGDPGTFEYFNVTAPDSANPLGQFHTYGAKGIFGAKVLSFAETVTGGTNDTAKDRVYSIAVKSGQTA